MTKTWVISVHGRLPETFRDVRKFADRMKVLLDEGCTVIVSQHHRPPKPACMTGRLDRS